MRLQAFEDLQPIEPVREGFRSGAVQFHDLLAGPEGAPANYGLQLVQVADAFGTPRHRHNFEQVRVMLDGEFGFGPGQVQRKGSVGYFCEGTYYTQDAKGPSTTLLLQIGGPSGQGFMSRRQLRAGIDDLARTGRFEAGVYTHLDAQGKKHNQDSYEAVWEHVHGRPVRYVDPQYQGPVLMDPEKFAWRAMADGVACRDLGTFNGQGLRLAQWRFDAGVRDALLGDRHGLIAFCLQGEGTLGGMPFRRWTSVEVQPGEAAALETAAGCTWFLFGKPDLGDGSTAAAR